MPSPHSLAPLLIAALLLPVAVSLAEDTAVPAEVAPASPPTAEPAPAPEVGDPAVPLAASVETPVGSPTPPRFSVAGEVGWNGLAGLGPVVSWRFASRLATDLGIGFSGVGVKTGARLRCHIGSGRWRPLLGAGAMYGSGLPDTPLTIEETEGVATTTFKFRLRSSIFLQAVAGMEFIGRGGSTWLLTAGYAGLLRDNVVIDSGTPSELMRDALRVAYGSGPVIAASFGYSF